MSTFDSTYYYKPTELIMAKDYVSSHGITLEVSGDTLQGAIATHLSVEIGNTSRTEYLIDVPETGTYLFSFRYSDRASAARQQVLKLMIDDTETASVTLTSTGAYRDTHELYATTTAQVSLTAGKHRLALVGSQPINHARLTWFNFVSATGISEINKAEASKIISRRYFTPQGQEVAQAPSGLSIERTLYANGQTVCRKIITR